MKTLLAVLASLGVLSARADVTFSAGIDIHATADFYQPLASHGAWVDVRPYGRCWHPSQVEVSWRPYSIGHWEWTDFGWYWVSAEPWAWAAYHYGSWVYDSAYGWIWIPGTDWAPAWVTWREGGDYIGWAPCGPGNVVLAPSFFVFVETARFRLPIRPSAVIVNDTRIINRTRVINEFTRETRTINGTAQTVVVNRGPSVEQVQSATNAKLTPVPVQEVIRQTPVPSNVKRRPDSALTEPQRGQPVPFSDPSRKTHPPTGSEQPRVYPVPAQPNPAPEKPSQVVPERPRESVPPEQPPSATGREKGYGPPLPPSQRPSREQPPAKPKAPPSQSQKPQPHDKDKDKEHP